MVNGSHEFEEVDEMGFIFWTLTSKVWKISVGGGEGGAYQMLVACWNMENCAAAGDVEPPRQFNIL